MSVRLNSRIITIDGPAASGKTTVTRLLAQSLGWSWVSTGAFYRGLAFVAGRHGIPASDERRLISIPPGVEWRVEMHADRTRVFFEGQDVTDACAQESVGSLSSAISSLPGVRKMLLQAQRDCAAAGPLVAEGRDCGTVVFPEAGLKIYLTAHADSRAERRALELGLSTEETKTAQVVRDAQDTGRKTAPLQIPDKALVIDTSTLSAKDVVEFILDKRSKA